MTGKFTPNNIRHQNLDSPSSNLFVTNILPWVICGLAAAFYCYEYLLRITPGLMVPELQRSFSTHGQYLDATLVGHLSAFYYYAYTPMQLPVGLLMDRYGPRWILTFAIFCCAAGTMLFGSTQSWWLAALGRFATGFGSAFAFVGVMKLASTWLPANRFAMISGLTTTLGMVGAMQGDIILSDLIHVVGWRETLLYSSYIGFILMPIIWIVVRNAPPTPLYPQATQTKSTLNYRQLWTEICFSLKNKQIWINGMIGGLIMAPTMIFPELWGKLYLQTVHSYTAIEASRAVTMIFLGWAVGSPIGGFLSDQIGRRRIPILLGALVVTLLLIVFLYVPGLTLTQHKILLFLIGIFSSVECICFAVGRENCSASLAGTAVAVTNFLIVSFAILQVAVAKVLDLTWDGVIVDQAKIYSVHSFQIAMLILPVATGLAFLLCFFLKETYCKPQVSHLGSEQK